MFVELIDIIGLIMRISYNSIIISYSYITCRTYRRFTSVIRINMRIDPGCCIIMGWHKSCTHMLLVSN